MAVNRNYTSIERKALDHKVNNPNEDVECPRCENSISYEKRGKSISVKCATDGCIFGGIRGL